MQPPKEVIEQTALIIAQDNMEVASCFIQKTAIEKALMDIDKRMLTVSAVLGGSNAAVLSSRETVFKTRIVVCFIGLIY